MRSPSVHLIAGCVSAILLVAMPVLAVEVAYPVEGFEAGGSWAPAGGDKGGRAETKIVAEGAHEGKRCLALTYDFTGTDGAGFIYAQALANALLPGTPTAATIWVKGDGSGRNLNARYVDEKDETFQTHLCALDFTDWRQFRFPLTGANGNSWGGSAPNGKPKPPLRLASLIVDKSNEKQPLRGTVYLDDVQVISDVPESEGLQLRLTHSYAESLVSRPQAELVLQVNNLVGLEGHATLRWHVADYAGRSAGGGKLEVPLAKGAPGKYPLRVKLPVEGWYSTETTLKHKGRTFTATTHVCRLTPSPLAAANAGSSIGINGHLADAKEMRMMQRAGIKWMRADWLWGIAQPKPGAFNWEVFDERAQWAREAGIDLLPVLCYGVGWATTRPADAKGDAANYMPQLEPWLAYIRAVVARYKGQIHNWEVWNEPNIGFWLSSNEEYVKLLKETYKAVKSVDPTARVVMGGVAGSPTQYVEMLYKGGCKDFMDVINIHPYQYPTIPEHGMEQQVRGIQEVMRKYGDESKELWATEVGYPNHIGPGGVGVGPQADYISRTYICLLASGVKRVFWYDYQNGTDVTYNEANFGIVYVDNSPKPCLLALKTTSNELTGAKFTGKLETPANVAAYEFDRQGTRVTCLYALKDDALVALTSPGAAKARDLMGNAVAIPADGSLKLTTSPLFLETSAPVKLAERTPISLQAPPGPVYPLDAVPVTVTVRNDTSETLSGTLHLSLGSAWTWDKKRVQITLPAGKSVTVKAEASAKPTVYFGEHTLTAQFVAHSADGGRVDQIVRQTLSVKPPWKVVIRPNGPEGMAADITNLCSLPLKTHVWWAAPLCPDGKATERDATFEPGKTRTVPAPDWYARSAKGVVPSRCELRIETTEGIITKVPFKLTLQTARRVADAGPDAAEDRRATREGRPWPDAMSLDSHWFIRQLADWRGPEDLSAKLRFLWDDANLYLQVAVTDDKFVQTFSGGDTWQGDGVQFAVQPEYDRRPQAKFAEFSVALVGGRPDVFVAHDDLGGATKATATAEIQQEGTRTVYRIAVPWAGLGIKPAAGRTIAVSMLVNDNDGNGRRGWMEWGDGIGYSKDPSLYYDLTLGE